MPAAYSAVISRLASLGGKLLLVDAIGAILSATCLFFAFLQWDNVFGIPLNILWILGLLAAVFALYSLVCYYFAGQDWRMYLWLIMIANAVYGFLTLSIVLLFFSTLTFLGLSYFCLELVVLSLLIYVEAKALGAG